MDIPASAARRLRDALEPLAAQGFYSARVPLEALGLSFIPGYVWSRAAALGEPSAAVVVAAFGVFEPTFLAEAYEAGRATASRRDVLEARVAGATRQLQEVLGDDDDIGALAGVLLGALEGRAATGRPLFSGLRALPVPGTPHGRLWRAAELVREHRGDGHIAVCVAAGLDPVEMNVLTELWVGYAIGDYSPTCAHSRQSIDDAAERLRRRGWLDGEALSPAGTAVREGIEAATDAAQDDLVRALGDRLEMGGRHRFCALGAPRRRRRLHERRAQARRGVTTVVPTMRPTRRRPWPVAVTAVAVVVASCSTGSPAAPSAPAGHQVEPSPGCSQAPPAGAVAPGGERSRTLAAGSVTGSYGLSVPAAYRPGHPRPLLLAFYGFASDPAQFSSLTHLPGRAGARRVPRGRAPRPGGGVRVPVQRARDRRGVRRRPRRVPRAHLLHRPAGRLRRRVLRRGGLHHRLRLCP